MTNITDVTRFVAARYCSDEVQDELLNNRGWASIAERSAGIDAIAEIREAYDLLTAAAAPVGNDAQGELSLAVRNAVFYIEHLQRELIIARAAGNPIEYTTDSPKAAAHA